MTAASSMSALLIQEFYTRRQSHDYNSGMSRYINCYTHIDYIQIIYILIRKIYLTDRQHLLRQGKILIQHPYDQHWSSSGWCSLPTALLPVHQ